MVGRHHQGVAVDDRVATTIVRGEPSGDVRPPEVGGDIHVDTFRHFGRQAVDTHVQTESTHLGRDRVVDGPGLTPHDADTQEAVEARGARDAVPPSRSEQRRRREEWVGVEVDHTIELDLDRQVVDHDPITDTVDDVPCTHHIEPVPAVRVAVPGRTEAHHGDGTGHTLPAVTRPHVVVPARIGTHLDEVLGLRALIVVAGDRGVVDVGVRDDLVGHVDRDLGPERGIVVQIAPQAELEHVARGDQVLLVGATDHRVELGATDVAVPDRPDVTIGPGLDEPAEVDDVPRDDLVDRGAEAAVAVRLHREVEGGRLDGGDAVEPVVGLERERPPAHVDHGVRVGVLNALRGHPALEHSVLAVVLGNRFTLIRVHDWMRVGVTRIRVLYRRRHQHDAVDHHRRRTASDETQSKHTSTEELPTGDLQRPPLSHVFFIGPCRQKERRNKCIRATHNRQIMNTAGTPRNQVTVPRGRFGTRGAEKAESCALAAPSSSVACQASAARSEDVHADQPSDPRTSAPPPAKARLDRHHDQSRQR